MLAFSISLNGIALFPKRCDDCFKFPSGCALIQRIISVNVMKGMWVVAIVMQFKARVELCHSWVEPLYPPRPLVISQTCYREYEITSS